MLQPFIQAFEALPGAAKTVARRGALEAFLKQGLPTTELEDWKYTDLAPLAALNAEDLLPQTDVFELGAGPFEDGLDALNAAFSGGERRQVISGRRQFDSGHHQRLQLKINTAAELRLTDETRAGFSTFFADIDVASGASLKLVRLQNAAAGAQRISRIRVRLQRDAQLEAHTVDLGGRLIRHDFEVSLDGPGAGVTLHGLFAPGGTTHVDNHTRIDHRAPHCSSREFFRGLAFDRSRAVFNGKIMVHPHAQKTDSEQRIASLLLSPKAEINAKPELQIEADDVKCAHGATFGQLDDDALFYLRSRGLTADTARALLTQAFVEPILKVLDAETRATVESQLQNRFAALAR